MLFRSREEYLLFFFLARICTFGVIIPKDSFLLQALGIQADRRTRTYWNHPFYMHFYKWIERFDTLDNWISRVSRCSRNFMLITFNNRYEQLRDKQAREVLEYDIAYTFDIVTEAPILDWHPGQYMFSFHDSYTWNLAKLPPACLNQWRHCVQTMAQLIDSGARESSYPPA